MFHSLCFFMLHTQKNKKTPRHRQAKAWAEHKQNTHILKHTSVLLIWAPAVYLKSTNILFIQWRCQRKILIQLIKKRNCHLAFKPAQQSVAALYIQGGSISGRGLWVGREVCSTKPWKVRLWCYICSLELHMNRRMHACAFACLQLASI